MPNRDYGQVPLSQLLDEVAGKKALVRACIVRSAEGPKVQALDVVVGDELAHNEVHAWRYEDVSFIAEETTGGALATWLRSDRSGDVLLGGDSAAVPQVLDTASFRREPTLARYSTPPLVWPHVV